ncbi:MAG TPA: trypsin-like peptidase domain-containing protein [Blastocatellia bacterium]|nr:trypsin-like peptidase domain-containing protein [Blastocatellia bacterium]
MASESSIEHVLDLLTKAPKAEIESLSDDAGTHAGSMRRIVDSKNVVALGISEKITKRKATGKLALTFYVEKKISPKKLKADSMIPPTVPEALSGPEAIPTDVVVLGKLRPEVNARRNPFEPGNSIGHVDITAGTLGAVVAKGNTLYLLSNSHVLALSGKAKKGDSIIYPGDADGGAMPDDLVAKLAGFKKFITGGDFVNHVDCAIAKPTAARLPDLMSEIKGLGVPKGTIKPKRGMKVVKVGRTTGKTKGEIRDVNFRFTLDYGEVGEVGFIDQVLCTRYTQPGDSGSLVIDQETGRAVGLHFAGASGGSVFNPIDDVLAALKVKLVTKSLAKPQSKPAKKSAKKTAKKTSGKKATKKQSKGSGSKKTAKKG